MRSVVKRAVVAALCLTLVVGVPAVGSSWLTYDVEVDGSAAPGEHPVEIWSYEPVDLRISSSVTGNPVSMGCDELVALPENGSAVRSGTAVDQFVLFGGVQLLNCTTMGGGVATNVDVDDGLVVRGVGLATSSSADVVDVRVDDFRVEFRSVIPGICSFDLAGSLSGEYREATSELVLQDSGFDGTLVVENRSGCANAFAPGDHADLTTTMVLLDGDGQPVDLNLMS